MSDKKEQIRRNTKCFLKAELLMTRHRLNEMGQVAEVVVEQ